MLGVFYLQKIVKEASAASTTMCTDTSLHHSSRLLRRSLRRIVQVARGLREVARTKVLHHGPGQAGRCERVLI